MNKRWTRLMILSLSLLLVAGMVVSTSAAAADNTRPGLMQQGLMAGKQQAQTALKAVAELTGLSVADIRGQRIEGKSLAAIAADKGVSEQAVIDKVTAERTAALNQLQEENKISAAQYEACLSNMQQRVKDNIERTDTGPGNGKQRGMGRMRANGQGRGMVNGAGPGQGICPYYNSAQ